MRSHRRRLWLPGPAPDSATAHNHGLCIKPGDKLPNLPEGLAASVGAALAAGQMVLCPTGDLAKSGAWWRIDPETGETLSMGPDGWGTSLVEYGFILMVKTLWAQIACMAITASGDAIGQAFEKGKVALPKTLQEAKDGTRDLANTCVQQTLFSSLTGISTVYILSKLGPAGRRAMGGLPGALPAAGHLTAPSGATGGKTGGTRRPGQSTGGKGGKGGGKGGGGKGGGGKGGSADSGTGGPPSSGQGPGGQGSGISPKASTIPPPRGNAPNKGGPTPAGYQAAHDAEVAAQDRFQAAHAVNEANPTPANAAARAAAVAAYKEAMQDRIAAWPGPGFPPRVPLPGPKDGSAAALGQTIPQTEMPPPMAESGATPGVGGKDGGGAMSGQGGQPGGAGASGPVDPFGRTVAPPEGSKGPGTTLTGLGGGGAMSGQGGQAGGAGASGPVDPFGRTIAPPEGSKGFGTTLIGLGGLTGALGGGP